MLHSTSPQKIGFARDRIFIWTVESGFKARHWQNEGPHRRSFRKHVRISRSLWSVFTFKILLKLVQILQKLIDNLF